MANKQAIYASHSLPINSSLLRSDPKFLPSFFFPICNSFPSCLQSFFNFSERKKFSSSLLNIYAADDLISFFLALLQIRA